MRNHTIYDNFVLENKVEDMLETMLDTRNFMTVDNTLEGTAGTKKIVHRYNYEGQVERLEMGQGNEVSGIVSFEEVEYEVEMAQQHFAYYDEQYAKDPMVVEVALKGATATMVNDMNAKFFEELGKASIELTVDGPVTYDNIVDAIALMQIENEEGLFLLVGTDIKADIRKDEDFKRAAQGEIIFNGQIGTVCGIPVVHSKKIADGEAFLLTKEAIHLITKAEVEVEQERDANTRQNNVYLRKNNIVALADATKLVKIAKAK